jgi:surface carbohydrate biosynthesis protein
MKKTVLFIEWSTFGRDFEIDLPLMYFFEKYLGWNVEYKSIFNLPDLLKAEPDLVIMSNTTGAHKNYLMAKTCYESNILLFSHISEGVIRHDDLDWAYWGWNKDKKLYEELNIIWNKWLYNRLYKQYPMIIDKIKISGSIGHDKYKIFNFKLFNNMKYKNYKKRIVYAGYDFVNMANQKDKFIKMLGEEKFNRDQQNAKKVNNILKNLIERNKDILFILKPHPGDYEFNPIDIKDLDKYENVLIEKNQSIVDLIANSDILLNYRSSTNSEAWLLGKPSITLCEDKDLLEDVPPTLGSVSSTNVNYIQRCIKEFYDKGYIKDFEIKKEIREKIIRDTIGFTDGFNHVRFMSFLKPYIEKIEKGEIKKGKWNISFKEKLKDYLKHFIFTISKGKYNIPFFKRYAQQYDIFDKIQLEKQKKLRYLDFDKFYYKNKNKIDYLYENWNFIWKKELNIE